MGEALASAPPSSAGAPGSSPFGVQVSISGEDGAADVTGVVCGVSVCATDAAGEGFGVGTSDDGSWAGRGCAACVVVFFAGSNADVGIALRSNG